MLKCSFKSKQFHNLSSDQRLDKGIIVQIIVIVDDNIHYFSRYKEMLSEINFKCFLGEYHIVLILCTELQ